MSQMKDKRVPLSVTVSKEISSCLSKMHGVELFKETQKTKSEITEEILRAGFKTLGIDPATYGQDINLSGYGSTS